jgi:hypothetical protein
MSHDKTKQALHELINNLDDKIFTSDVALSDYYLRNAIGLFIQILKNNQKPKEKTLEEKLIDYGFEMNPDSERSYIDFLGLYRSNLFIHQKSDIVVRICGDTSRVLIGLFSAIKKSVCFDGKERYLFESKYDNHDQIFADITYLESRIR